MTKSILDVFDISAENSDEAGAILSVAGVRSRTPLYAAEIRNLERRQAYKARRGESTVALTNRMAMVSMQNSVVEGEVTKLRWEVRARAPGELPNDGKVIDDLRKYD